MADDENVIRIDLDEENKDATPPTDDAPDERSRLEAESFGEDLQKELDQLAYEKKDDLETAE